MTTPTPDEAEEMRVADEQRRAGELIQCTRCATLQPRWKFARGAGGAYQTCRDCRTDARARRQGGAS